MLNQIFEKKNIRYQQIGNQLILDPKGSVAAENKQNLFTIKGQVKELSTGETLPGATIRLSSAPGIGVSANSYGFYSLSLPEGKYTLLISYMGFEPQGTFIDLKEDLHKDIYLEKNAYQLNEVEVVKKSERISGTNTGDHRLSAEVIKAMPAFGGKCFYFLFSPVTEGLHPISELPLLWKHPGKYPKSGSRKVIWERAGLQHYNSVPNL